MERCTMHDIYIYIYIRELPLFQLTSVGLAHTHHNNEFIVRTEKYTQDFNLLMFIDDATYHLLTTPQVGCKVLEALEQ